MDPIVFHKNNQSKEGNDVCFECRTPKPRWCNLYYGIYICLECAGAHRELGPNLGKVISISLDKWTQEQMAILSVGGNIRASKYFQENQVDKDLPVRQKYQSEVAQKYRQILINEAKEQKWDEPSSPTKDYISPRSSMSDLEDCESVNSLRTAGSEDHTHRNDVRYDSNSSPEPTTQDLAVSFLDRRDTLDNIDASSNEQVLVITSEMDHYNIPISWASHLGQKVAKTRGNLILNLQDDMMASISSEEGHMVHNYIRVFDSENNPRFILKRRVLHREIQIFIPGKVNITPTPQISARSSFHGIRKAAKSVFNSNPDRSYAMSCVPLSSRSTVDWEVKAVDNNEKVLKHRNGTVAWYNSFERIEPEIIFALTIAIRKLWEDQKK